MNLNNTQMKTQIFWKRDNFNGWFKNYLIAMFMHVHIGIIKNTIPLGKTKTKASFHLLDVI